MPLKLDDKSKTTWNEEQLNNFTSTHVGSNIPKVFGEGTQAAKDWNNLNQEQKNEFFGYVKNNDESNIRNFLAINLGITSKKEQDRIIAEFRWLYNKIYQIGKKVLELANAQKKGDHEAEKNIINELGVLINELQKQNKNYNINLDDLTKFANSVGANISNFIASLVPSRQEPAVMLAASRTTEAVRTEITGLYTRQEIGEIEKNALEEGKKRNDTYRKSGEQGEA